MSERHRLETAMNLIADLTSVCGGLADAIKYLDRGDSTTAEVKREAAERALLKMAEKLRGLL